jgi:hypothetical protein
VPPLADCDRCDVVFDFSPDEVYAASERAIPAWKATVDA